MPLRPRSHQLETESRLAFEQSLPSGWVFRPQTPDYGIDGAVELFDRSDRATGESFLVQLKATDQSDLTKALKVRLSAEHCRYYAGLDLPVLLVRYHSPSKALFTKWMHSVDPYYAGVSESTWQVTLTEEDRWESATPEVMVEDLKAWRAIRAPWLSEPIPLRIVIDDDPVHEIPAAVLKAALRRKIQPIADVLRVTDDHAAIATLRISNAEFSAAFARVSGFTVHTREGYFQGERDQDQLSSDLVLSIALGLRAVGHHRLASRIMGHVAAGGLLIRESEIAFAVSECFSETDRIADALDLARLCLSRGAIGSAEWLTIPSLRSAASWRLRDPERRQYESLMVDGIELAKREGTPDVAARWTYNLGSHLRCEGQRRRAFSLYRDAAVYDPTYWDRGYFVGELAGQLFAAGRYRLAAIMYRQAISLGDVAASPLLGDALMHGGYYEDALDAFSLYLHNAQDAAAEWRLKHYALSYIVKQLGVRRQQRRTTDARERALKVSAAAPPEVFELQQLVLSSDALCAPAWHALGTQQLNGDHPERAVSSFTIAAVSEPNVFDAWWQAVLAAAKGNAGHIRPG